MGSNVYKANGTRVAKNTLLLYFRMILLMGVSLYTSRVNLQALGVSDYGIYNVVGGLVAMFTMLSGSLTSAISRFITFQLGRGGGKDLQKIFSCAVTIQLLLSVLIIVIAETVGLWYINNIMNIPSGRIIATNWVFQFSLLTFVITLISVPYNALIVAHEHMGAFAYISILEAFSKLAVAFLITISPFDHLILYSFLLFLISIIIRLIYSWYSKRHFEECDYSFVLEKSLFKQMFSFAGWNFFGVGSGIIMHQGISLVINLFFGVVVNAARGIANQVDNAIMQFVSNFMMALNPQITKTYAVGDYEYLYNLIFVGAKTSYFLMLFFAIPFVLESNTILHLWLAEVPCYTSTFLRLVIFSSMLSVLSNTMITAMLATGNIKKYQIIIGSIGIITLPLVILSFTIGLPVVYAYYIYILILFIQLLVRLYLLAEMIQLSIKRYIQEVILRIIVVSFMSLIVPLCIHLVYDESFLRLLIVGLLNILTCCFSIFFLGLKKEEKMFVLKKIQILRFW